MWVGTLLLVTICARSSKFGVTISGPRSSAMNWDLWWELLITLNIWDAWMNRLAFAMRIKSTLLWRLSCLFTFPTKVDLSLVALCSAQSLVSACVHYVHLSKENHQLFRWAPEKSRYPPPQLHHQPWEWFSKSWWSARFLTEPNKVMMLKSLARMRLKSFTTGSLTQDFLVDYVVQENYTQLSLLFHLILDSVQQPDIFFSLFLVWWSTKFTPKKLQITWRRRPAFLVKMPVSNLAACLTLGL